MNILVPFHDEKVKFDIFLYLRYNKLKKIVQGGEVMKKFILGFVLGSMIFGTAIFAEEALRVRANPYPVLVDGSKQQIEAYNINDYTYLKLADVGKALGAKVIFNETDSQIEITKTVSQEVYNKVGTPIQSIDSGNTNVENSGFHKPTLEEIAERTLTIDKFDNSDDDLKIVESNGEKYITAYSAMMKLRKNYPDSTYSLGGAAGKQKIEEVLISRNGYPNSEAIKTGVYYYAIDKEIVDEISGVKSKILIAYCMKYDDFKNIIVPMITKK